MATPAQLASPGGLRPGVLGKTDVKSTLTSALPPEARAVLDEAHRAAVTAKLKAGFEERRASEPPAPENDAVLAATEGLASTVPPAPATARSLAEHGRTSSRPPPSSVTPKPPSIPVMSAAKAMSKTLIGMTSPTAGGTTPIVPRRRTPSTGTPSPLATATLLGMTGVVPRRPTPNAGLPKVTPAAGTPPPPPLVITSKEHSGPPPKMSDPSQLAPDPGHGGRDVPPVIRIPQGGMLGSSAPTVTPRSKSLLCQVLLRDGAVSEEDIEKAIAVQEERGGQIGRILVSMGACSEDAIARALIEQLKVRKKDGYVTDVSLAARENKDVAGLKVLTKPNWTIATLIATDLFSLLLAALLATAVHWARTYSDLGGIDWTSWLVVGPGIGLCMLTYLGLELYSPMAKSTPDEIRDIVFATSLVHLGASMLSTLGDLPIVKWGIFVRAVWWLATLFLVPVVRSLVRNKLCTQAWWGIPVCVLGAAKTGRLIVRTLKAQPRSGLKPVMLLDDDPAKHGTLRATFTNEVMDVYSVNVGAAHFMSESQRQALADDLFGPDSEMATGPISSDHLPLPPSSWHSKLDVSAADSDQFLGPESVKPRSRTPAPVKDASQFPRGKFAEVDGVPVVGELALAPILATRLKIPYAVLAMPGVDGPKLLQIVERVGGKFSHLLVIPDLFGFATLGVPAKNLGGILGVEVRQQLLLPGPRLAKRVMDATLTGIGILFVLPFLLLIALLIKLDSKGPIFYWQNRLGKDGEFFRAYKFRTMHGDGEARLKAILDNDPQLRAEYEIYHKLRKDPRVTRIGRVLRKFSLDEFPQLLNVLLGDMSLVGPRPYIEREVTEMGGQEKIILRAPPGMTGMWQVSDRNATSFAQRVQIDVYYVRNWSPWLDIHILAKTFGVVVKGSGV
ncbi:MAG: Undecaprenyl-phosphate galactose phosphotransferase, WbaP [Labilithrix sp.]|nr:Undecaprenyl-phosphate galactose phosphotransferase, WbaP [Labilithrix sp.]